MICTTKTEKLNRFSSKALICAFWLVFWQALAMIVGNSLLLPTVFETVNALGGLVKEESFYIDVAWTMLRCILAIVLSFFFGMIFAWLSYRRDIIRSLMTLPVNFFKAVPVMAIVIYVILLVHANWVAVVACFLMCFPIAYTNILSGLDSVPEELIELAKVYELKGEYVNRYIVLPSIFPSINAAMKIISGLSWKAVVAAEVLSVPKFSLGQGMISAKYYLETPTLFAYIAVIVVLSLCLEKLIVELTAKFTSKRYKGSKFVNIRDGIAGNINPLDGPKLRLVDVSKSFDGKEVLDEFTEDIEACSKVAIVGPSGSGKTTLARIIAGLEKEDSGIVDYTEALKVAYLFQEDRLLPWLNVHDNLCLGMLRGNQSPNCDAIIEMAKALELADVLWQMPGELSGGMKHRVAIGRTLLADCNLLIFDEPFRGLDDDLKGRIVNRLWDKFTMGKTVLVITHNQEDLKLLNIEESIYL